MQDRLPGNTVGFLTMTDTLSYCYWQACFNNVLNSKGILLWGRFDNDIISSNYKVFASKVR